MLRDLGVKPSKSLPQPLVELATANERPIIANGQLTGFTVSTEGSSAPPLSNGGSDIGSC
ncbi:hypothetical protein DID96_28485 [Burkholderia sp. Bp8963]|nr:hypothetical protein DID96_28485 [Burkholderia sp. Bp8963]